MFTEGKARSQKISIGKPTGDVYLQVMCCHVIASITQLLIDWTTVLIKCMVSVWRQAGYMLHRHRWWQQSVVGSCNSEIAVEIKIDM